jgi:hypothetical protein
VYPQAGEAGGQLFVPGDRKTDRPPTAGDAERAEREANRRARAKVRRYCAANRLNRLGTLTYANACEDPQALRQDVAQFFIALRALLAVKAIPYLWVPEWHPGGHGLHVHFVVGRFVKRKLIERAWDRGIVHIKLIGDLPVGSGTLAEARQAARYVAPYTAKSADDTRRPPGLHRYEVGQGFQPRQVRVQAWTPEHAVGLASRNFGGTVPAVEWTSNDQEDWDAPPSCWFAWD